MIVYVVTDGAYSAYRIWGAFIDKHLAEKVLERIPTAQIEEYDTDNANEIVLENLKPFRVLMFKNGDSEVIVLDDGWFPRGEQYTVDVRFLPKDRKAFEADVCSYNLRENWNLVGTYMNGFVFAKDEKHAVKTVNEWKTQTIATGEWDKAMDEWFKSNGSYWIGLKREML